MNVKHGTILMFVRCLTGVGGVGSFVPVLAASDCYGRQYGRDEGYARHCAETDRQLHMLCKEGLLELHTRLKTDNLV